MTSLVTLDETKLALRINHTDDDIDIEDGLIPAASEAIIAYLKDGADSFLSSGGEAVEGEVPFRVKRATILLVKYLYDGSMEELRETFARGELPFPVTAMIYQMRDPALA